MRVTQRAVYSLQLDQHELDDFYTWAEQRANTTVHDRSRARKAAILLGPYATLTREQAQAYGRP